MRFKAQCGRWGRAAVAALAVVTAVSRAHADPPAYLKIRRLLAAGQYEAAFAEAKIQARQEPRSYRTLEALVEAGEAHGARAETMAVLEALQQADPGNPHAHHALGLAFQNAKDYVPALDAFRRAVEREPKLPLPHREIAYTHRLRGTLDEARAEIEGHLARDPDLAAAHYALGFVHNFRGDTLAAITSLDRAIALDPDLLDAYRYGSQLHFRAGDFQEALRLSHELRQRAQGRVEPLYETTALNTLAAASLRLAAYDAAVSYYEDALALQHELGDRQGEWSSLDGLGVAYETLGEYDKAHAYHRRALALAEPLPNASRKATTLHNIGVTCAGERDFPRARTFYFQALTLRRALGDRRGQAYTLRDVGMSYLRQGEPSRARQYLEEAAAAAAAVQDAFLHAVLQNALAESDERTGAFARARSRYERARHEGERIQYAEVVWRARRGLGAVSAAEGQWAEAEEHYAAAVETIEAIRHNVQEEAARTVFLQGKMAAYEGAVELLYRRHRRSPGAGHDRRAFEYAERAKARTFLDLLAEARVEIRKDLSPEQRAEEQQLLRGAARAQRALLQDVSGESLAAREKELAGFEDRLESFERERRRRNPAYAALRRPEPERLDTLQAELRHGPDRLALYLLGEERSFAWLVSGDTVRMAALPARGVLEKVIQRYLDTIRRPPTRAADLDAARVQGRELFDTLLGPFAGELAKGTRLTVIPDGVLHYLPFETLVRAVGVDGQPRYLLETHDIAYAPSASVLAGLNRRPPASTARLDLLAYGDPPLVPAPRAAAAVRAQELAPLIHARGEVQSIAALFPEGSRRVRLGSQATESSLKNSDLSQFRILHLATHGRLDPRMPARSGLLFAPGDTQEDGLLQGAEILNLELDADLVVLSACGSGLGRLVKGEGLVGVTRAFLYAGARRLVVSLWNVDDESTAALMKSFYRRLRQGTAPDRALRDAKLTLVRSDRPAYRFPYYWASFVLIGETAGSNDVPSRAGASASRTPEPRVVQ